MCACGMAQQIEAWAAKSEFRLQDPRGGLSEPFLLLSTDLHTWPRPYYVNRYWLLIFFI